MSFDQLMSGELLFVDLTVIGLDVQYIQPINTHHKAV